MNKTDDLAVFEQGSAMYRAATHGKRVPMYLGAAIRSGSERPHVTDHYIAQAVFHARQAWSEAITATGEVRQ